MLRREIIENLIKTNYDFKSNFPYDFFSENSTLQEIKQNLIKENNYYKFYITKGTTFTTLNGLKALFCKTDKKLTPYIFRFGYDIYFNSYKGQQFIALNPLLKKEYSLENILTKLNKEEKDIWVIWNKGMVVKTARNKKSKISSLTIKEYIKAFNLKG